MGKLTLDITMSLDGFIAGPNNGREYPLGEGGQQLHEWGIGLASWRERHGRRGRRAEPERRGHRGRDREHRSHDHGQADVQRRRGLVGGRRWPRRLVGDDPPFRTPVFILTQHAREPVAKQGGTTFTFVTEGIETALGPPAKRPVTRTSPSRAAPASSSSTCGAGLLDELQIHLVPVSLGGGVRLFDQLGSEQPALEATRVIDAVGVTHLKFRVVR